MGQARNAYKERSLNREVFKERKETKLPFCSTSLKRLPNEVLQH